MHWQTQWRSWRRMHPLRLHIAVLLALKLIALFAIHHYFFSETQRVPVDDARVAARLLISP